MASVRSSLPFYYSSALCAGAREIMHREISTSIYSVLPEEAAALPEEMKLQNLRKAADLAIVAKWLEAKRFIENPSKFAASVGRNCETYSAKDLWIILFGSEQRLSERCEHLALTVSRERMREIQKEIKEIKTFYANFQCLDVLKQVPRKDKPGFFLSATAAHLIGAGVKKVMEAHVDCIAKLPSLKGLTSAWTTLQKFSGDV